MVIVFNGSLISWYRVLYRDASSSDNEMKYSYLILPPDVCLLPLHHLTLGNLQAFESAPIFAW